MVVGSFKSQVDRIWDDFASGGLVNPLTVIEQFTYLMFMKQLDDMEKQKEKNARQVGVEYLSIFSEPNLRWSEFLNIDSQSRYQIMAEKVFPFIKQLNSDGTSAYSRYMKDAMFLIPTPLLLEKVILGIDTLLNSETVGKDHKGDLYEYLLSKLTQSGRNGQFRTPRHIINMMVQLMKPKLGEKICDPAMGSAGFLVEAAEELWEQNFKKSRDQKKLDIFKKETFYGYDTDQTMLRIGAMNMMLHHVENPRIEYRDSLSERVEEEQGIFDLVLANPPFKGSLDEDRIALDLLRITKTKKTELLFVALFINMLKIGGRCACIVPDGVLFGASKAHKALRQELVDKHQLEAIISMPSGVFKPYAGVSTGILIFTKTGNGGTDKVWFYDMKNDGFSLDDKRTPIEGTDIPDIVACFDNQEEETQRTREEQSFFVPKEEIIGNDYDLSINKYKQSTYVEEEYPHPQEILAEINELEKEIIAGFVELEEMLHG